MEPTIKLNLPLSAVNYILNVLSERPHKEVNGLVTAIIEQAKPQAEAQAEPAVEALEP